MITSKQCTAVRVARRRLTAKAGMQVRIDVPDTATLERHDLVPELRERY